METDILNPIATILAAIGGAIIAFLLSRIGRKSIYYKHKKDISLTSPEVISQHKIQIRYGDYEITGRTYFTEIRVRNKGLSRFEKAAVRLVAKSSKQVKIINVVAQGSSSFIQDRIEVPTGDQNNVTVVIKELPSRGYCDVGVVLEAEEKLYQFEDGVEVEIEADGILGHQSKIESFLRDFDRILDKFFFLWR